MEQVTRLIGLAIVVFVSTNVDDIFVLLGFFADPKLRVRDVVIGQYLGIAVLYSVSVLGSLVSLVVPPAYLGLLGLAPVAIGLKKLWELRSGDQAEATPDDPSSTASASAWAIGKVLTVASVTIANGGDNIGIYTPLFATHSGLAVAVFGIVFAVMVAVWCVISHALVNHPTIGAPIRLHGHRVVPFVLVALGLIILHEAGTFRSAP